MGFEADRVKRNGWAVLLAVFLLTAPDMALGGAPETSGAAEPQAEAAQRQFRFWPRRIFMEHHPDVLVQLSHPERSVRLHLTCEERTFEIAVPMWSHREKLLHVFDLSWLPERLNDVCRVSVSAGDSAVYESNRKLVIKPSGPHARVTEAWPLSVSDDHEAVVDIAGGAFTGIVNVVWVSPSEYLIVEHSARSEPGDPIDRVVVPFSPQVSKALPGQYLVVVENRDRSAAVLDDVFTVAPASGAEIVETLVETDDEGNRNIILLGIGLDRIHLARLHLEAGTLPLALIPRSEFHMSAVSVMLPPHVSLSAFQLADISIADQTIEISLVDSSKLSRKE